MKNILLLALLFPLLGVHAQKWEKNYDYVYNCVCGLSKVKKDGKILYMKQNEKMPIVRKAFEMKMAGTTHKKISKYLRENNIKIGERELTERYF